MLKKIVEKAREGYFKEMYKEARWMYGYVKRYRLSVCFYIVMGIVGTVMGFGGSIASKYLIDAVTGDHTGKIGMVVGVMISMVLLNIITKAAVSRISAKIMVVVQNEIRAEVYDKIIYTDWEALHAYRSGDLLSRLSEDVRVVSSNVINWIPGFITKFVQFAGAFGIILYYDITMAVIALLSAPVTLLISRYLVKRMRDYNKEMREVSSEMMSFQNDSFQNLQTVKAFGLMDIFSKKMRSMQMEYKEKMMDYNKFHIYISSFMSIVGTVVSYLCFGWGVYRLWSGAITYGTMTLFLQMAGSVSSSFSALVQMFPAAIGATTSAGRLMAVTELKKEVIADRDEIQYIRDHEEQGVTVTLEHVEMIYQEGNSVFSDGDMIAKPGEVVAVIGPSGEGKTTLIRLLLGIITPGRGALYLETEDGCRCQISAGTREFFSYVPQGNTVFTGTVAENMRMVKPDATDEEIIEALKVGCAYEFIEKQPNGIYQEIGERGIGFSEGQAQRIAIARAVLRDARVVLLDEATSALDTETEERVLRNLMSNSKKKTCIVTTHRPSVLSMCDHIYEMKGNRLEKLR